jgi:hypothetical protein
MKEKIKKLKELLLIMNKKEREIFKSNRANIMANVYSMILNTFPKEQNGYISKSIRDTKEFREAQKKFNEWHKLAKKYNKINKKRLDYKERQTKLRAEAIVETKLFNYLKDRYTLKQTASNTYENINLGWLLTALNDDMKICKECILPANMRKKVIRDLGENELINTKLGIFLRNKSTGFLIRISGFTSKYEEDRILGKEEFIDEQHFKDSKGYITLQNYLDTITANKDKVNSIIENTLNTYITLPKYSKYKNDVIVLIQDWLIYSNYGGTSFIALPFKTKNEALLYRNLADYIDKSGAVTDTPADIKVDDKILNRFKSVVATKDFTPIPLNKQDLKQLVFIADKDNPKIELNFIYFSKENKQAVATDTRAMLVKELNNIPQDLFIYKEGNTLPLGYKIVNGGNIVVNYGDFIWYYTNTDKKYPNYKRILPTKTGSYIYTMQVDYINTKPLLEFTQLTTTNKLKNELVQITKEGKILMVDTKYPTDLLLGELTIENYPKEYGIGLFPIKLRLARLLQLKQVVEKNTFKLYGQFEAEIIGVEYDNTTLVLITEK